MAKKIRIEGPPSTAVPRTDAPQWIVNPAGKLSHGLVINCITLYVVC